MPNLEEKSKKYLELLPKTQDKYGFIDSQHCDSLMFTSLVGCLPEVNNIDIDAAFDYKTGMWHRRPTDNPCFDCKKKKDLGSKSSISRDMLLSLAHFAYYNNRLDISEQVIKYAMTHWGFMGCAIDRKTKWGRCQIMPGLFATFCWVSYKLGGPSRPWARWIPADMGSTSLEDFQAHLQVLHILLRNELTGKRQHESVLNYHASRQPRNPLFLHAVGKDMEAMKVLQDETLWPSDRLPRRSDRKTNWIPMRDAGEDWEGELTKADLMPHSGGDFLFIWWLLSKKHEIKVK